MTGAAGFSCFARSPKQAPVLSSQWHTVNVAQPWHYLFETTPALVPLPPTVTEVEMILFVDGTGYRLPPVTFNALEGTWQVTLPMNDPMIRSLGTASALVLQVGAAHAWSLPTEGLKAGLKELQDECISTWNAAGVPTPGGFSAPPAAATPAPAAAPAGGFTLPGQVQAHANRDCSGVATFNENALQAGDLDGDGAPDIVLDWGRVLCIGQSMRGFCGAANCQYDIFLSTQGYALSDTRLAVSATLVPHRTGRMAIGFAGTAGVCSQIDCSVPWLWNGAAFVQVP